MGSVALYACGDDTSGGEGGSDGRDEGVCGDGVVDDGEQCDDGNDVDDDACPNNCLLQTCGDAIVQEGEQCDDGNRDDNDSCTTACQPAACGDGYVQPGEACDDGNTEDDDQCTSRCALPTCGDGVVQDNEECDDGNQNDNDDCLTTCVSAICGDGVVLRNVEECDDGNTVDGDSCLNDCTNASCGDGVVWEDREACDDANTDDSDGCTTECTRGMCGDGVVQAGEECDDGNSSNVDGCLDTCLLPSCGDGYVQSGETCDDGNQNNNDSCVNTCELNVCGDGFLNPLVEICDDGNSVDDDACTNSCTLQTCGDAKIDTGEECDDGNLDDGDGCLSTCLNASCGDGFRRMDCMSGTFDTKGTGTTNDDICCATGNRDPDGSCSDGPDPVYEQCDDADGNDANSCTSACSWNICGDGSLYTDPTDQSHPLFPAGLEQCDDGNSVQTDACTNQCTTPVCGDGVLQAGEGEQCDQGELNSAVGACTESCMTAVCGDGFVREDIDDSAQPGYEECDDGNMSQNDECLDDCTRNSCGDGHVWTEPATNEFCDEGDMNVDAMDPGLQADDCVADECRLGSCGDGVTQAGLGEECDPADTMNFAAGECTPVCTLNICGDGHLFPGFEACDDGNAVEHDDCKNNCTLNVCGDGVQKLKRDFDSKTPSDDPRWSPDQDPLDPFTDWIADPTLNNPEPCDDGNTENDDACLAIDLPGCGCTENFYPEEAQPGINCDLDADDDCDGDGVLECVAARCGDGYIQAGTEECDDGASDDQDGDGFEDSPDANWDACVTRRDPFTGLAVAECVANTCGDGLIFIGLETCDDGNAVEDDLCTSACLSNLCGSGGRRAPDSICSDLDSVDCDPSAQLVQDPEAGMWEECDDANINDNDSCIQTCRWNRCGDGHVYTTVNEPEHPRFDDADDPDAFGVEACDDGNYPEDASFFNDGSLNINNVDLLDPANRDSCVFQRPTDLAMCQPATCGDGIRRLDVASGGMGYEECEGFTYDPDLLRTRGGTGDPEDTLYCLASSCVNQCATAGPIAPSPGFTLNIAGHNGQQEGNSCYTVVDINDGILVNDCNGTFRGCTFTDADVVCGALDNAHLVVVNDQAENDWVRSFAGGTLAADAGMFGNLPLEDVDGVAFWIGLSDRATEGMFEWVDGSGLSYTNWDQNGPGQTPEPNSFSSADITTVTPTIDCAVMDLTDGFWRDEACSWDVNVPALRVDSRPRDFVCEYEFPPAL